MLPASDNTSAITFHKYAPLAILYIFFNGAGLPEGLMYTTFLTPLFIYDNLNNRLTKPLLGLLLLSACFALVHFYHGVNVGYYVKSWINVFCNFNFCLVIYSAIKKTNTWDALVRPLIYTNLLLVIAALGFLFIPSLLHIFWYTIPISPGVESFPRMKLLASEPAVYSQLIAPLFLYCFFTGITAGIKQTGPALAILILSFLLSFSLGVIVCLVLSLIITSVFYRKFFYSNPNFNKWIYLSVTVILLSGLLFFFFKPDNAFFLRIRNVFTGNDTSYRGRTYESFILAFKMLSHKSMWFGVGLGQIKELGRPIVLEYYKYINIPQTIRIPNATAEMLIYYGIVGLGLKLFMEWYLFVKCKVMQNPFRFAAFVFVFIYQFTGSYLTNISEYVLWIIAFTPVFLQFNMRKETATT